MNDYINKSDHEQVNPDKLVSLKSTTVSRKKDVLVSSPLLKLSYRKKKPTM